MISVAALFTDSYNENEQTRRFVSKMAKLHSGEHFAFLYSYLASHEWSRDLFLTGHVLATEPVAAGYRRLDRHPSKGGSSGFSLAYQLP